MRASLALLGQVIFLYSGWPVPARFFMVYRVSQITVFLLILRQICRSALERSGALNLVSFEPARRASKSQRIKT